MENYQIVFNFKSEELRKENEETYFKARRLKGKMENNSKGLKIGSKYPVLKVKEGI